MEIQISSRTIPTTLDIITFPSLRSFGWSPAKANLSNKTPDIKHVYPLNFFLVNLNILESLKFLELFRDRADVNPDPGHDSALLLIYTDWMQSTFSTDPSQPRLTCSSGFRSQKPPSSPSLQTWPTIRIKTKSYRLRLEINFTVEHEASSVATATMSTAQK